MGKKGEHLRNKFGRNKTEELEHIAQEKDALFHLYAVFSFSHYFQSLGTCCDQVDENEGDRRMFPLPLPRGGTRCLPRGLSPLPGCGLEGSPANTFVELLSISSPEAGITTRRGSPGQPFGMRRRIDKSLEGGATSSFKDATIAGSFGEPSPI